MLTWAMRKLPPLSLCGPQFCGRPESQLARKIERSNGAALADLRIANHEVIALAAMDQLDFEAEFLDQPVYSRIEIALVSPLQVVPANLDRRRPGGHACFRHQRRALHGSRSRLMIRRA